MKARDCVQFGAVHALRCRGRGRFQTLPKIQDDPRWLMVDFYHLDQEGTPLTGISRFGEWIVHVQTAGRRSTRRRS